MKQQGNNLRKDTKKSKQQNEEQRGNVSEIFLTQYIFIFLIHLEPLFIC